LLKKVKAIGWYIEEYGVAQISMNLTDISVTSVHEAFDAVEESARQRGIRVTGSELVGLIPLNALLSAGKHYLKKQKRSVGVPDEEIIKIAVKSLGLDELKPFNPKERIIEFLLDADELKPLVNMNLQQFTDRTAEEFPAPGGGSIAAYMGTLGAALGTMVANLSAHKRGWDDKWEIYSDWAEKGMSCVNKLLPLVDEDTKAFNQIMEAYRMPKSTDTEKELRKQAIQAATKHAIDVPFRIMEYAYESMAVMKEMAINGLQVSLSDAGVGALAARAAVLGAYMNVKINMPDLEDKLYKAEISERGLKIEQAAIALEKEIYDIVHSKIS
jgi:glutamate formiminotransferase/formiminotetrahydrofolate cyclodeaminase